MKKANTVEEQLISHTITINPSVVEQLSDLITKIKEVEPVYKHLNESINIVVKTIIGQEGFDIAKIKDLSVDDKNWTISFKQ